MCDSIAPVRDAMQQDGCQRLALGTQAAALAFYIICGFLSLGFVTNFVVIIVFLMLDFWIVSSVISDAFNTVKYGHRFI